MIALLTGLPQPYDTHVIMDVRGVGYDVAVSATTFAQIQWHHETSLWIYTHMREQSIELFGFPDQQAKQLFQLLLSVSGVGPSTALAISGQSAQSITTAIQQADISFFTKIPRVGKKLAQKIIIELTSKLGSLKELDLNPLSKNQSEAHEALIALGFDAESAREYLRELPEEITKTEVMITTVLKQLGK